MPQLLRATRPLTTIMAWPIQRGPQAVFLAITQDPGVPFTCEGRHKPASSPALGSADVDVSGNSVQFLLLLSKTIIVY